MKLVTTTLVALGMALSSLAYADDAHHPERAAAAAPAALSSGEIKKIDKEAGKVTIKHGDIKHLDMPGMTMVFTAKDKGLLSNLKPGDKVRFRVVDEAGAYVVTEIQPAP